MSNIQRFPIEQTLEFPMQHDQRELWLLCIDGHPPARQKKILLEAQAAGYLSKQDTHVFLDAYGLGGA